ncbi:MAG: SLBB domain-containing protein [Candidatus Izemoplasmatales bacterium]|jgi:competence protein ComEA|nr:SLBB domain-containing protein [Candidatus Izemoplasmatales bacterium]MDD3865375.1 SLBB domain-containing protein [Candidatus Izemoplasmatales bacterium]
MLTFIKRFSGFFLLIGGIVGLIVVNIVSNNNEKNEVVENTTSLISSTNDGYVLVDIKGAVVRPGVYRVSVGSRIQDVINAADGLLEKADLSAINASVIVVDEMVIIIPEVQQEDNLDHFVCVDIKGQIAKPGIYWLPVGSRIGDALVLAGGLTINADVMTINQAQIVSDEMVIYIPSRMETSQMTTTSVLSYCYVQITGEIIRPGLYYVKISSTIRDVINLAGGLSIDASTSNLELAEVITAGMTINVLSKAEAQTIQNDNINQNATGLININTATLQELDSLYGIGSVLAQAIIDFRAEYGYFASIEDIMLVSGIKQSVYEKIKDDITV